MADLGRRSRRCAGAVIAVVATLVLAACGGGAGTDDGPVTLRFTWWGGDLRAQMTQQVIAAFEAENPDIKIAPEPGTFQGYFDKLSTQAAAGDAPDIIQINDGYFNEYLGRGALLDLTDLTIDHSAIDDSVWNTGVVDGKLYGVPSGVNTHVLIANPTLFAQAGLPLPDDDTWTWADYEAISTQLSQQLGDGKFGSATFGLDQNGLAIWLRQHGADLFSPEGGLGFTAADAAPFFELLKKMSDEGAIPGPEEVTEQTGIELEQSGTALGRYAMGWWASNQLANLNEVTGVELALLKPPTVTGSAADGKFSISGGWYAASARTEHPEQVAKFMDFIVNNQKAGDILLTERGAPANNEVRQALIDGGKLNPADAQSIEFLNALSPIAVNPPPAVPPVGAGSFQTILRRITGELLFGRVTPLQAAEQLIQESNSEIR